MARLRERVEVERDRELVERDEELWRRLLATELPLAFGLALAFAFGLAFALALGAALGLAFGAAFDLGTSYCCGVAPGTPVIPKTCQ